MGTGNDVTAQGGSYNSARNIGGSSNELSIGGLGSNLNTGFNLFSSGNHLTVAGPGTLNAVLNAGGGDSTVSAGGPGSTLTAGFNFLGTTNTVAAGPGPLALAGSVLQDGQTVTKTDAGIAINNFRIGGAALTSGNTSTALNAQAAPASRTVNAAGATTVSRSLTNTGQTARLPNGAPKPVRPVTSSSTSSTK